MITNLDMPTLRRFEPRQTTIAHAHGRNYYAVEVYAVPSAHARFDDLATARTWASIVSYTPRTPSHV